MSFCCSGGISVAIGFPTISSASYPKRRSGRRVPGGDDPVQVLGDDRVLGGLDDRLESPRVVVHGERGRGQRRSDGPAAVQAFEFRLFLALIIDAHASSLLPSFLASVSRTAVRLS